MSITDFPQVAVIADAHFHDMNSDYDCKSATIHTGQRVLRSWADTRRSSRVFNESAAALNTALTDIGQRGIQHVVLLGDYTDDGQVEANRRLVDLLRHYKREYGIAFYAIPGNHDVYGLCGKHQSTRFITAAGESVLVTSDESVAATEPHSSVLTPKMFCEGIPAGLLPMAEFGLFKQDEYVYWESPFGQCDDVNSRLYDAHSADGLVTRQLMDASYLVEPVEGLWLLMIDANVFEPRNGHWKPSQKKAFLDSSDAGWNSVLRVKPFLIRWIADVCSRAKELGKRLFCFSHYPILDTFNDQSHAEFKLFGNNHNVRRKPTITVAESLLKAGVQLHFGGHLHVNGRVEYSSQLGKVTDIAVPSLVAFPPGFTVINPALYLDGIHSVSLSSIPIDAHLRDGYQAENKANNEAYEPAFSAANYGEFLYKKTYSRVAHYHLVKEWPEHITAAIDTMSVADVACLVLAQRETPEPLSLVRLSNFVQKKVLVQLATIAIEHDIALEEFTDCSMMTLIVDWYCLRQAGAMATVFIAPQKLKLYTFLSHQLGDLSPPKADTPAAFFTLFLGLLHLRVGPQ